MMRRLPTRGGCRNAPCQRARSLLASSQTLCHTHTHTIEAHTHTTCAARAHLDHFLFLSALCLSPTQTILAPTGEQTTPQTHNPHPPTQCPPSASRMGSSLRCTSPPPLAHPPFVLSCSELTARTCSPPRWRAAARAGPRPSSAGQRRGSARAPSRACGASSQASNVHAKRARLRNRLGRKWINVTRRLQRVAHLVINLEKLGKASLLVFLEDMRGGKEESCSRGGKRVE